MSISVGSNFSGLIKKRTVVAEYTRTACKKENIRTDYEQNRLIGAARIE